MDLSRALKDLIGGSIFVAFGLAFAIGATTYEVGTPLQMGPGYFPLILGGLLVLIGLLVMGQGLIAGSAEPIGPIPWRSMGLIVLGLVLFGVTVRGLGVVPSVFGATLLSAFAAHRPSVVASFLIAAGLTTVCVLIFIFALQLRLPLFGPWIRI